MPSASSTTRGVLGHMRAAYVFASPSTREGFGITNVEAIVDSVTVMSSKHIQR